MRYTLYRGVDRTNLCRWADKTNDPTQKLKHHPLPPFAAAACFYWCGSLLSESINRMFTVYSWSFLYWISVFFTFYNYLQLRKYTCFFFGGGGGVCILYCIRLLYTGCESANRNVQVSNTLFEDAYTFFLWIYSVYILPICITELKNWTISVRQKILNIRRLVL